MKLIYVLTLLAILSCLSSRRSKKQVVYDSNFCTKLITPFDCLTFYHKCMWRTDLLLCVPRGYPAYGYGYRRYPLGRSYLSGGIYGGYTNRPVKYTPSVFSTSPSFTAPVAKPTTQKTTTPTSTTPSTTPPLTTTPEKSTTPTRSSNMITSSGRSFSSPSKMGGMRIMGRPRRR